MSAPPLSVLPAYHATEITSGHLDTVTPREQCAKINREQEAIAESNVGYLADLKLILITSKYHINSFKYQDSEYRSMRYKFQSQISGIQSIKFIWGKGLNINM